MKIVFFFEHIMNTSYNDKRNNFVAKKTFKPPTKPNNIVNIGNKDGNAFNSMKKAFITQAELACKKSIQNKSYDLKLLELPFSKISNKWYSASFMIFNIINYENCKVSDEYQLPDIFKTELVGFNNYLSQNAKDGIMIYNNTNMSIVDEMQRIFRNINMRIDIYKNFLGYDMVSCSESSMRITSAKAMIITSIIKLYEFQLINTYSENINNTNEIRSLIENPYKYVKNCIIKENRTFSEVLLRAWLYYSVLQQCLLLPSDKHTILIPRCLSLLYDFFIPNVMNDKLYIDTLHEYVKKDSYEFDSSALSCFVDLRLSTDSDKIENLLSTMPRTGDFTERDLDEVLYGNLVKCSGPIYDFNMNYNKLCDELKPYTDSVEALVIISRATFEYEFNWKNKRQNKDYIFEQFKTVDDAEAYIMKNLPIEYNGKKIIWQLMINGKLTLINL